MKIGILQTGHVPESLRAHGSYPDMFGALLEGQGFTFETYAVVDGVLPSDPQLCDAWLITGSRHGAYEDHAWIPPLEAHIRAAHEADIPMVGICFGHQIMAQALGGRVEKFAGGWAVGPHRYKLQGREVIQHAWHQDQVVTPPPGAETVACSDFCTHAALLYGRRGFSVQWHPEFDAGFVAGLLDTRAPGIVPRDLVEAARRDVDRPVDRAHLAQMIGRFLRERRI